MIQHKWIGVLSALLMAASVIFVSIGYLMPSIFEPITGSAEPLYVAAMDKTEVLDIQIIADEDDWADMLENATAKEYIAATVIIDSVKIENVGIRPKGNSSLNMVASDDTTDRYSFKIEFDHYVSGQTWLGLDKIVVNNMQGDSTYMKEYLSYDIMAYAGVETPLYAFSNIHVNGESWGFYLAIEVLEDSYAQRIYGNDHGKLYKPESMGIGGGGQMDGNRSEMPDGDLGATGQQQKAAEQRQRPAQNEDGEQLLADATLEQGANQNGEQPTTNTAFSEDTNQSENLPPSGTATEQGEARGDGQPPTNGFGNFGGGGGRGNGGGGFGSQSGGTTLQYTDDEISSYSNIFDKSVFKSTDNDYARVIASLKKLSEGEDLESVLDVEANLKYFAAHAVLVNLDSYVSNMAHNYYLYEKDGQLTMLPWDFNLAFGGFQSGSASSVVNFPIDTPVSGVSLEDRPILGQLLAVPEYMEQYHTYLQEIVDGYFSSGVFEQTVDMLNTLIAPYVEADPTAFYDYDAYQAGVAELKELGVLRAQSIQGQLDGTIPATTEEQNANPSALVDASSINLSVLGSMGGGMGGGGDRGNEGGMGGPNRGNAESTTGASPETTSESAESTDTALADADGDIVQAAATLLPSAGENALTEEQQAQLEKEGLSEEQTADSQNPPQEAFSVDSTTQTDVLQQREQGQRPNFQQGGGGNRPQGGGPNNANGPNSTAAGFDTQTWIVLGTSTLLLLGGILFVVFYKRRRPL